MRQIFRFIYYKCGIAIAYLQQNAKRFHINTNRMVLAGESAGAQIAAKIARSPIPSMQTNLLSDLFCSQGNSRQRC
ncbi:alpha/beta hydrolase [Nostoc sp.]|uniref:alpha/beta hydrolase n=1 Tax=Nostoc sp. TaxID=1180 RepID=UPI002FF69FB3